MTLDPASRDALALRLGEIACEAGRLILSLSAQNTARLKADGSPSTEADLAAERLILERLAAAWPDIPVVAEETAEAVRPKDLFFLVDPLDGTRDFIAGSDEYCVNIALVAAGRPVAAAVAAPALGRLWVAGTRAAAGAVPATSNEPLRLTPARTRPAPAGGLVALVSRRHGDEATEQCLASLPIAERRTAGSALKFCLIASGEADLYVRCGPTREWDTAAGDHVLTTAGGGVVQAGGSPLTYGRHGDRFVNGPFAALGDPSLAPHLGQSLAVCR